MIRSNGAEFLCRLNAPAACTRWLQQTPPAYQPPDSVYIVEVEGCEVPTNRCGYVRFRPEAEFQTACPHARKLSFGLTFDISGGTKGAKRLQARPLDGGVRSHSKTTDDATTACSWRAVSKPVVPELMI